VDVDALLTSIPALAVYLLVGLVIGLESMGIPLPGEVILVSSALLASRHGLDVSPVWIAVAATAGAIVGDSLGYLAGQHWGIRMFDALGRRFPKHAGPDQLAYAELVFTRYGVLAVFFGRFVALLRIFAGPSPAPCECPTRASLRRTLSAGSSGHAERRRRCTRWARSQSSGSSGRPGSRWLWPSASASPSRACCAGG
jgi:membrane protein YqaA with SNARE-associated domain